MEGVFIGFGPDWKAINAYQGFGKTSVLHYILRRQMECGAVGVRLYGNDNEWALPIFKAENCPVHTGLGWNGLWKRPGTYSEHLATYLKYVTTRMQKYAPELVWVDQEHPKSLTDELPGLIRGIVDKEVGPQVPVYYYRGDEHFYAGVGSGRCPRLYQWWNKQAEMELLPVHNGAPWGSMFSDAWHLDKGLVLPSRWRGFCGAMGTSTARFISAYPSPYGKFASLDSPIHETMLGYMAKGAEAFRAGRKDG